MQVTVLYFASARERAGVQREMLELPEGADVNGALRAIVSRHPSIEPLLPHLRIAVDQEFANRADRIPGGAELALIPPVAGGSSLFEIVERPLSLKEVISAVEGQSYGGLVTFSGVVRGETGGRRVIRLEYEAHVPMARKSFEQIGVEISRRWPGTRLAIVHRIGRLLPGELAVVIAAAAPHRTAAFRACEFAIEQLKAEAPIWKKEFYEDGEVWVGLHP